MAAQNMPTPGTEKRASNLQATDTKPQGSGDMELTPVEREQISRRAYAIWAEEGYPEGQDQAHWSRAELEILKARH